MTTGGGKFWQAGIIEGMKTKFCIAIILLAASLSPGQTNSLTALLQQGLFEEQASRNLDAAITDYQTLAAQFEKDRQLAATAVFRRGECYRAQGRTNEAAAQYQRILQDFSDQSTLVTLSRQDLTGMGMGKTTAAPASAGSGLLPPSEEAGVLSAQLSALDQFKDDPDRYANTALALFPDSNLESMVLQRAKLQDQVDRATLDTNIVFKSFAVAIGSDTVDFNEMRDLHLPTRSGEGLAMAQHQLQKQRELIAKRENFIVGLQKTRLQVMQTGAAPAMENADAQLLKKLEGRSQHDLEQLLPTLMPSSALDGLIKERDDVKIQRAKLSVDYAPQNIEVVRSDTELKELDQQIQETISGMMQGLKLRAELPLSQAAKRTDLTDLAVPAASEEDQEIARLQQILQNSPDLINAAAFRENRMETPLVQAVRRDWPRVVKFLLENGATLDGAALIAAADQGHKTMVELLLERGADVNARNSRQLGGDDGTALHVAAQNGFLSVAEILIQHKADLEAVNNEEQTPLHRAAIKGWPAMVTFLLSKGADANARDRNGLTPLGEAVVAKQAEITAKLLKAGSKPDNEDVNGKTALDYVAKQGDVDLAKILLAAGADPNAGKNSSTLFDAVAHPQILKLLLVAGAKPNVRVDKGTTPLLSAVESGHAESAALLIQSGADVNDANDNGMTPLQMAVWAQNIPMVSMLLSNKVDINARHPAGRTALGMSVEAEHGYHPYHPGDYGGSSIKPDVDIARKMSALLREHGALEKLPYWDRITLSRPATGFNAEIFHKSTIFHKDTNDWNHFTLLEFIYQALASQSRNLPFPDFNHVVVARPGTNGTPSRRIEVNLLDATNNITFAKDIPLEFGDVVEIPERGHTLAEKDDRLNSQYQSIASYLKAQAGQVRLVAAGSQPVMLSLSEFPTEEAYIGVVLKSQAAENVLTSSSDLARVKLTRHDSKTMKTHEWSLDCSGTGTSPAWGPELLLRDGDVIEVPQKP